MIEQQGKWINDDDKLKVISRLYNDYITSSNHYYLDTMDRMDTKMGKSKIHVEKSLENV